ncbi:MULTISPECIES: adenylate/guanylate cyclase domain-containing protein [Mesorhizobium]|uniref:Guanylyl cyclase n=2 Tax=Mesorhizobium TaxID=68287 RepID=A0A1A5JPR9_RHILI|nr:MULTISPECIES: adenylate/guanylate cyclase domain-containing protein [Mesorhizobium]MBE1706837.1 adenylate/guanylate cyclase domain-containing protein [Mesorhizobium japonicum]MBE1716264.1 adenylate/guanylate cyclase domain-containing protein [Mesorhizobium japonicum]MUT20942.1 tetratricopeptide repeat protein [Mesorhizobium japonicum]MUT31210.1 tetratricopeptide repeat protein [Mesorhizobium japonicum]OBP80756.1 guanylyl cyclase [Mesorhizobium loti]
MSENRKLAAILAADVVGYSRLASADEDRTLARLRALRSDLIDPIIAVHNGRVIKRTGDGALVEFRSVVDAVRCAVEVQNGMVERNAGVPQDRRIEFRIGIHLGDVVEESDGDLMGDGVNIASRLEGVAAPGAICLSEDAYRQVKARLDLSVSDLGSTQLKNIAEPIRVYSLQVGSAGTKAAATLETAGRPATAAPPKLSIAVLPFANMSGDAEQDYFADGISEDIITALSKLSQLFVIARNSSFTFKGQNVQVQEVGTKLGVRHVLEGSVRKSGNRVRITAQLIDAISGGHLWAERFDRELTDIFAVQDDVTQQIVGALALNLTEGDRQRLAPEHPRNAEVYDCFLRGRELWHRLTKETNVAARDVLQRAIDLDPNFASAHAFLALTYVLDYLNRWSASPPESMAQAEEVATRAVALDDSDPWAHWALAIAKLYTRRHDGAIDEAERAIVLNPNFAEGHVILGEALYYSGRPEEALESFARAKSLNPYFPDVLLHFQALAAFQLGRYEEAVDLLLQRLARNAVTDVSRALLAACYGHLSRFAEARAAWQEVLRLNPDYSLEYRRKVLPYKNPTDFELVVDGLRKAGVVQ